MGVPTDIYFAGQNLRITVLEEPSQVAEAFNSAQGAQVRLSGQDPRYEVYVNPAAVAFWSASQPSGATEDPEESQQRPPERDVVTDIWGMPLRRRPRR